MCPVPCKTGLHVLHKHLIWSWRWPFHFYDRWWCHFALTLDWQSCLIELGWTCDLYSSNIADVFAKKIGGNPLKQQKPRLNQTTYTVHAPSSIERLLRSSYRHSLEQVAVEPYRAAPSRVRCLARPDCMFFTSIWFEVDGGLFIFMTGDGVTSLWHWIGRVAWSSWVELVTCIHQI